MENISGWKSSKKNRTNIIIGDENNPTQFSGGEVIINKKATKKNLKRLEEINDDGSGKTTTDASDGGLLSGPSHDNGGIPGIVGGVRQIETEGDEFVVSQEASEKHWKELSAINQSTGGVAINKPSGADDDPEEYKEGGKIKFQANKLPNKRILKYAEKIKAEYPKVWDLGGNIFGNQAFKNLKRVSERGFWLDSEEWMFIKWRSYVARHQKDFRIEGVIAMLKWVDTVDRGWAYMKNLIDAEIEKRYPNKMKEGGRIKNYAFVESVTTNGIKVYKLYDHVPTNKEVFDDYKKIKDENGNPITIKDSDIKIETFTSFNRDTFLEQANKVAVQEFGSEIDDLDELIFSFDKNTLNVFPFEAELENDKEVTISVVDGFILIEKKPEMKYGGRTIAQTPALPPLVKKDALDIVLKGGSRTDLDKLRNPNKKSYTLASDQIYEDFGNALVYAILNGLMTKDNLTSTNYQSWAYGYSILFKDKAGIEEMIEEGNFDKYIKQKLVDPIRVNEILKSVGIDNKTYKTGGRTIAQTPTPKNDRIKGSKINPAESSESLSKASSIKFSAKTLSSIKAKVEEHNEAHPDKKITLASAKAVVRRGMGAYSSTHRPTIDGGKPNDRTAWGLARLNAFTYKIVHGKSKSGKYTQDDDLINELGYSVSKYHLGGDMTKHLAPNGKPSNLNHEQWHLVRTPEFKVWFGDWENDPENSSKVIDENGEPLVVYHGTYTKFNVFRYSNSFYFTPDKNVADKYAKFTQKGKQVTQPNENPVTLSCFLNIRKLLVDKIYGSLYEKEDEIIELVLLSQQKKYNGILLKDTEDFGGTYDQYIVFNSNQIKLADGTNTTFDGNNPDIRFKDGGELDDPSKIFSASSRFRPAETIFFDPALVGPNGNKLISYTWKYQWTVDFNKTKGEEFEKRVSDWTQAEESAETGRNIVHAYTIEKPNGEVVIVSSESVPILMGLVDREQKKVFANLATASKTLAKQQMKLAILEAQEKEYLDAKEELTKSPKPQVEYANIEDLPFIYRKILEDDKDRSVDKIFFKMGDVTTEQYLPMFQSIPVSSLSNPTALNIQASKDTIEQLESNWVSKRLNELGLKVPYGIYDLRNRVERQKRKVENIIATEKMADGGSLDEIAQIKSEINHLYSKAFKMMPNSPRQKEVIKQIDELRLKLEAMGGKFAQGGSVDPFNFTSYEDAQIWMNQKSKEYKNQNEFYTSDEYKLAYPIILKLYEVEKSSYSKMAKVAMQEADVHYGDRVFYDYLTPFMDSEKYSGIIVERNGLPYVKFDEGQQTISGAKSTKWHKGWKKEKFAHGGLVDGKDTVTVDIPLMIRLLELSREDIHSDEELHMVVERLLNLKNKLVLTMDDYAYIAEIEHKHLKKMALGGNIETEKLISQAHTNLTMKRGRRDYAPTTAEIQEEIDRMIMEEQFGSTNI